MRLQRITARLSSAHSLRYSPLLQASGSSSTKVSDELAACLCPSPVRRRAYFRVRYLRLVLATAGGNDEGRDARIVRATYVACSGDSGRRGKAPRSLRNTYGRRHFAREKIHEQGAARWVLAATEPLRGGGTRFRMPVNRTTSRNWKRGRRRAASDAYGFVSVP